MKGIIIIGLSGNYCAGKNYIADLLKERSFPVLDVDKLGHEVIKTEKEGLVKRFGEDILGPDGLIDRKRLGAKVFGKPKELAALEEIIHPAVNRETLSWINNQKVKVCFINAALLHRSSAYELLDAIILVEAPFPVRLCRAKRRDHLPLVLILKRFWSQRKFYSQLLKKKTDIYRVSNPSGCVNSGLFTGRETSLRNKLEKRLDEILSLVGISRM